MFNKKKQNSFRNQVLDELKRLQSSSENDPEDAHQLADNALLEYINDIEITDAFDDIKKWYS